MACEGKLVSVCRLVGWCEEQISQGRVVLVLVGAGAGAGAWGLVGGQRNATVEWRAGSVPAERAPLSIGCLWRRLLPMT